MEQKERMDQGLIYDPADNRISTEQTSCLDAQYEFNATRPSEMKKRAALLKQMLGAIGENCYICLLYTSRTAWVTISGLEQSP